MMRRGLFVSSCIFLDYTLGRFGRTWEQESLERTDVAGRSRTLGISSYNPSPFFSTSGYLKANPDVAEAGVNPLVHWEEWGHREARRRGSVDLVALRKAHPELVTDMKNGLVRLRVTNACNAKCRYCGVRLYFGPEREHMMEKSWLFDVCRPLYSKIKYLLLTGGDPLITPHSYEFMDFISREYPQITIMAETNGIAFDERMQDLAARNLFRVHVSMNASTPEVYEKSCWEGEKGGALVFQRFTKNIEQYLGLLKEKSLLAFAPDLSMVINHDNYFDVVPFIKKALSYHAMCISFYFDYTENDMNCAYFTRPDISRKALRQMMEIERVLAEKVFLSFRLWVPTKELAMMQEEVDAEPEAVLKERYADLLALAKGRSIVEEHEERNARRRKLGKAELTFDEDYSPTIRLEKREGRNLCFAPWKELDLYPNGRIDFCGWYEPTLDLKSYIECGKVDWNEVLNCYAYMRGRYRILLGDYDECQDCCPMNDQTNPILNLYEHSCPSMA